MRRARCLFWALITSILLAACRVSQPTFPLPTLTAPTSSTPFVVRPDPSAVVAAPAATFARSPSLALAAVSHPDWQIAASVLDDVTADRTPEWVLLVWRPWRDWPIQRWSTVSSPIAGFHDAAGESCHLILLDPQDGREIWAGSALPAPLLALVVEDVDGDRQNEIVTLEGTYENGRDGPGLHVDVWRWNGFGFTLAWRSASGRFDRRCLADREWCGTRDALIDQMSSPRRSR